MAVDSRYPNLALMKLARWHRERGDDVEWYDIFGEYDIAYLSKVFTFTPDYGYPIPNAKEVRKGGTGYDLRTTLPDEVDHVQPDYSLYPSIPRDTAYGFLTRGCPNHCKWCVVPKKEGGIRPYMDIEEIAIEGRRKVVLMDNNVLASDYGLAQIAKIAQLGLRIDFNQALDARLVTEDAARLLASVKWIEYIRFGCDTQRQVGECERAVALLRRHGYSGAFFFYCIIMGDLRECHARISHWRERMIAEGGRRYTPFAQPYRDFNNPRQVIPQWQRDMARWVNKHQIFTSCDFMDYSPRRGFKCGSYFKKG